MLPETEPGSQRLLNDHANRDDARHDRRQAEPAGKCTEPVVGVHFNAGRGDNL